MSKRTETVKAWGFVKQSTAGEPKRLQRWVTPFDCKGIPGYVRVRIIREADYRRLLKAARRKT